MSKVTRSRLTPEEQERLYNELSDAIKKGYSREVGELIAQVANVKPNSDENNHDLDDRLLISAVKYGRTEIAEMLIKAGIGCNGYDDIYGQSVLMSAAQSANHTIVKLLIDNGADVNFTNLKGQTPLSLAPNRNTREIINKHKQRLDQIAEYIQHVEINKEPSTLSESARQSVMQDLMKFHKSNIADAIANKLLDTEIINKVKNSQLVNDPIVIEEAKSNLTPVYFKKAQKIVGELINKHKQRLDEVAEYIQHVEINKEPSPLSRLERLSVMKDVIKFKSNIVDVLTHKLLDTEIINKVKNSQLVNDPVVIEEAKINLTPVYFKKAQKIVEELNRNFIFQINQDKASIKKLPSSISAKILTEFLNPKDKVSALNAFATKANYPEAIDRARRDINTVAPPPPLLQ